MSGSILSPCIPSWVVSTRHFPSSAASSTATSCAATSARSCKARVTSTRSRTSAPMRSTSRQGHDAAVVQPEAAQAHGCARTRDVRLRRAVDRFLSWRAALGLRCAALRLVAAGRGYLRDGQRWHGQGRRGPHLCRCRWLLPAGGLPWLARVLLGTGAAPGLEALRQRDRLQPRWPSA